MYDMMNVYMIHIVPYMHVVVRLSSKPAGATAAGLNHGGLGSALIVSLQHGLLLYNTSMVHVQGGGLVIVSDGPRPV